MRPIWPAHLLVEIPRFLSCGGIVQLNCHNRSQHVEGIYGSLILSVLHVPPEKHPTENGVTAGKL